jgi:hypothetical protein
MAPVPGLHYFDLYVRQMPFIHFEEKVRRKKQRDKGHTTNRSSTAPPIFAMAPL